jgi:tRNA (cytosine34-C5)-methyltransferase
MGVYDRIICDVPCSGEGKLNKDMEYMSIKAIRKSPATISKFHPENGIRLHSIQLQIALRAAHLLK